MWFPPGGRPPAGPGREDGGALPAGRRLRRPQPVWRFAQILADPFVQNHNDFVNIITSVVQSLEKIDPDLCNLYIVLYVV